jgi:hypothetical protein
MRVVLDLGHQSLRFCLRAVRQKGLLTKASIAIDGSKFKAVKNCDKIFTRDKIDRRRIQWPSLCKSARQMPDPIRRYSARCAAARNTLSTSRSIVAGEEGLEPSLTRVWNPPLFR